MSTPRRLVVIGAGAVGGLIAARLAQAGDRVDVIARGPHLGSIRADGLRMISARAEVVVPLVAHASCAEAEIGRGDAVLLAVKSQHTMAVLDDLRRSAAARIPIFCAQNGVANERMALRTHSAVYGMCVVLAASHVQPGVVVQHAWPHAGVTDVGRWPLGEDDLTAWMARRLRRAGFLSEEVANISTRKHRKLLGNLSNALDAVAGVDARTSDLRERARAEALACFAAAGIEVEPAHIGRDRWSEGTTIVDVPGHEHLGSSSSQSLARGSGDIETDWLNGEVVLLGRLHGVRTPVNEALQCLANDAARERRAPGARTLDDIRAVVRALEDRRGAPG